MSIGYNQFLSPNFQLKEFCQSRCTPGENDVSPNKFQIYLVKELCIKILQPIRDYFNKPITITSGMRNKKIMDAMKKNGFHPSKTTDHSYLDPEINRWGVGATDFYINGVNIHSIYKFIARKSKINNDYNFGQAIIYTDYKFIHVSNPITTVFSEEFYFENIGKKQKYLKSSKHTGYRLLAVNSKGKILNL